MIKKLFFLSFILFSISCSSSAADLKEVVISSDGKSLATVKVEIADSPSERAKGLMYRKELPEDQGMWFIFGKEVNHPFWMENTFLSLDIIFVDSNNKIVSIARKTTPLSRDKIHSSGPYKYVLEVNAGYADKYGLKTGDNINLK